MDAQRQRLNQRISELTGADLEASQDPSAVRVGCPLHSACREGGETIDLDFVNGRYRCRATGESGSFAELLTRLEGRGSALALRPAASDPASEQADAVMDGEFSEALTLNRPVAKGEARVKLLTERAPDPEALKAEHRRRQTERLIIGGLALCFVAAGLTAAALSGFANYQAFAASVPDPAQGRIWGWAGILAAIVSFGGFTFVYWHSAHARYREAFRALILALIGAATSILGTDLYIRANASTAEQAVQQAGANRAVLETQIADWRRQLDGIPPETRTVEGLEIYLAEVERVGRTEQKPYRDAQNELGLARRRDDLEAKIEAANAELLGVGSGNILLAAEARASLPGWLFAVILETFSSQGTSIGLVALMMLFTRRREVDL